MSLGYWHRKEGGIIKMKKEQSDRTIELIREHLSDMGLQLPIKKLKEVETINDYFEDLEI